MEKFPLHLASKDGDIVKLEHLIAQGCSIDALDDKKMTPLHLAAKTNQLRVALCLIGMGCDIDVKDINGNTPLLTAADDGYKEAVKLLLSSGADIAACNVNKWNLLHFACWHDWMDVAKVAMESEKLDVDRRTRNGHTPVMIAAQRMHRVLVKFLIASRADVSLCLKDKWTLLHHATQENWTDIVKDILDMGQLDMDTKSKNGYTALTVAAFRGHKDLVKLLLASGADPAICDEHQCNVLHYAAIHNRLDIAEEVLKMKPGHLPLKLDLDIKADTGYTALMMADGWGHTDFARLLLASGADVNVKNRMGKTVFHSSIPAESELDLLRLYIEHGAYFERAIYRNIFKIDSLKRQILGDAGLCTTALLNKFNHDWLPAIYLKLAGVLPFCQDSLRIHSFQNVANEIGECVSKEIRCKAFCNVVEIRVPVLKWMSARALIGYMM